MRNKEIECRKKVKEYKRKKTNKVEKGRLRQSIIISPV